MESLLDQNTVFICYRRKQSKYLAKIIYDYLKNNNFDVFLDIETINRGDFEEIILSQIAARVHFIVILSKGTFDRTINPDDWLRIEIEEAIKLKRNIIPVTTPDWDWNENNKYFEGSFAPLKKINGVEIPDNYMNEALERLKGSLSDSSIRNVETKLISGNEKDIVNLLIEKVDIGINNMNFGNSLRNTSSSEPVEQKNNHNKEHDIRLGNILSELHIKIGYLDISGKINAINESTIIGFSNNIEYSILLPIEIKKILIYSADKIFPDRKAKWKNLFILAYIYAFLINKHQNQIDYFYIDDEFYGNEQELKNLICRSLSINNKVIPSKKIKINKLPKSNPARMIAINTRRRNLSPDFIMEINKNDGDLYKSFEHLSLRKPS